MDKTDFLRMKNELETIGAISRLFLESENLDDIYTKLPELISQKFGFPFVVIEQYNAQKEEMIVVGAKPMEINLRELKPISCKDSICAQVVNSGLIEIFPLNDAEKTKYHPLMQIPEIQHIICLPLKVKSSILGTLILACDKSREEILEIKDSLEVITHHLSMEIERKNSGKELANVRKQLKEQNDILESIFSNTHFLLAYMDKNFNFIRVNQAYANSDGKSVDYFEGKNHFDLYPHEENEAIFKRVVETGKPFNVMGKPFDYPNRSKDETTYWNWTLVPTKNHLGEVDRLLLGLIEVTDVKLAEKEKHRTEKNYLELKEKSLDGYARTNMDGRFLEVNKAFENLTGYTQEELLGMTYSDITPEKWHAEEEKMVKKLYRNEFTPLYEKEYVKKDGTIVPIELRAYLIEERDDRPAGMWAFVRDITIRKKTEKDLKIYAKNLENSNKALEEFVYFASHDLQEPLRKIKTFGGMLSELIGGKLDETGKDYLDRMVNASDRMRHLIKNLLNYSEISKKPEKSDFVDLNIVLNNVLSNLYVLIEKSGSIIQIDNLPGIYADPTQMLQLFQNLLTNAIKFQHAGSIPHVVVGFSVIDMPDETASNINVPHTYYEIFVRDNGIGIDNKHIKDIFSPFHRLHARLEYEGVGMGLAICKKIVERHGGTISAENNPEGGATFKVILPKK